MGVVPSAQELCAAAEAGDYYGVRQLVEAGAADIGWGIRAARLGARLEVLAYLRKVQKARWAK